MSRPIIEIENISKLYRLGANRDPNSTLWDELTKFASRLRTMSKGKLYEDFWALKDVSFSVRAGEVVGVIGRNGAGKSTLLKILSQITPPTSGKITMRGRVSSLLEVGTGFHPDLTGRENIYLNGAILGMTRTDIKRKFDEIVAFSEIEKFLDTPVKRYSSGMYVRLAFAVAAHLEPEILIVDEVLAVGDAEFQRKCLGKMNDVARGGRTVLFVSHNMAAVSRLCSKGVVLDRGKVIFFGDSDNAVRTYLQNTSMKEVSSKFENSASVIGQTNPAKIIDVELTNGEGVVNDTFFVGDKMTLNVKIILNRSYKSLKFSFIVKSLTKGNIYHCVTNDAGFDLHDMNSQVVISATFPRLSLYPGAYVIDDIWIATSDNETLDCVRDVLSFQIAEGGLCIVRTLALHAAVVHEVPEWKVTRIS